MLGFVSKLVLGPSHNFVTRFKVGSVVLAIATLLRLKVPTEHFGLFGQKWWGAILLLTVPYSLHNGRFRLVWI